MIPDNSFICADCLDVMRDMPDCSINCCITSPPYWGLRDYGVDGQLGLEASPEEYVQKMVEVFRGVRRVLKDDGTLWLNLGDTYVGGERGGNSDFITGKGKNESKLSGNRIGHRSSFRRDRMERQDDPHKSVPGLKKKDLVGIPWRVAFALQADGWYLRQDIIWHKPNSMPESVTDRCTKAHEYVFLLSKSEKYYFDADAIKEKTNGTAHSRGDGVNPKARNTGVEWDHSSAVDPTDTRKNRARIRCRQNESFSKSISDRVLETRNRRSVWTVSTKPFSGAHFATFPQDLIEPMILAGCPEGGIVLDPFGGAGTTALAAHRLGRKWVLIELNQKYVDIAKERIAPVFAQGSLFDKPAPDPVQEKLL